MPKSKGKGRTYGLTVEIGGDVTKLDKALGDVNKEIRNTQDQLKDVERLLKIDPGNIELLRQKQRLLTQEIDETGEKLETLKDAEAQVQKQFERGEVGQDQYEALKREIIATERTMDRLRESAKQTDRAIDSIDDGALDDVSSSAKAAKESLEDAGKEAASFGDVISAGSIIEGAKGLVSTLGDLADETKEYRKIMGSLEVSSEGAGYSAEETWESYKKLYGILDDEQSSATALANLQALGTSQDKLMQLVKGSIGAWAKYGDSIPIDSLAESINETAKTGKVTGAFADVLNWAGKSEDYWNEKLEEAGNSANRVNLILQELTDQGLIESAEAWEENNKSMVENNETRAEMQKQLAELGETIEPVMTKIIELATEVLEWFNGLDEGTQKFILGTLVAIAAIGPLMVAINGIGLVVKTLSTTVLPALGHAFSAVFSFIVANPIVLLIAAIVGLVALIATKGDEIQQMLQRFDDWLQNIFTRDWTEVFGPILGNILNGFFANVKNVWDSIKTVLDGVIDFIRGVFTGNWKRAWEGIKEIVRGTFGGLVALVKGPTNGVISLVNGLIDSVNWVIRKINSISFKNPFTGRTVGFNIGEIGQIPYLEKGGTVLHGDAIVGEAGPELLRVANGRTTVLPLGRGEKPRPVAAGASGGTVQNFTANQYITSPTPLNTYEIYRETKSIMRQMERRARR